MNGLPETLDLTPFVGGEITQVGIGDFQFTIQLDINARIFVEGICIYVSSSGQCSTIDSYRAASSFLCKLIGLQILEVRRTNDGGMELVFSDGTKLQILNSNEYYESFQVEIGGILHAA